MKKRQRVLLAALMCCSIGLVAGAADPVYELNPVLVTAQRMQTDDLRTPATLQVISGGQIEKSGTYSAYDVLRRTVGMSDYAYDNGYGSIGPSVARVYLRGLDKGTLVLVNGTPLNQMNYAEPGAIPAEAIERIEIVKGSNAVLYGAEAMGGVVNIITKSSQMTKPMIAVTGMLGKDERRIGLTAAGDGYFVSYGQTTADERANAQYPYYSKGYVSGYHRYTKEEGFASVRLSPEWTLNWAHGKIKNGMFYDSITKPGVRDNGSGVAGYKYTDTRDNVNLQYANERGTQLRLAYNTKKIIADREMTSGAVVPSVSGSNYRVNNFYFDAQQEADVTNGKLIYGLTAYREEYKQVRLGTGNAIGRNQVAIFGSYEREINDRWKLTFGAREHFSLDNGWDESQRVFLPQLQSSYMIRPDLNWYINIGKSFEMPAVNSKFSRSTTASGPLKPQSGWTYETGVKWIRAEDSLKIAAFYMDVDNLFGWEKVKNLFPNYTELGLDPNGDVQINRGDFRNKGIEAEYRRQVTPEFGWFIGYTVQDPKNKEKPTTPWAQTEAKQMGVFGFDWTRDRWSWSLDGYVEAKRPINARTADFGKKPIPDRISLNSTFLYNVSPETQLQLTVRNILNRENYTRYLWEERPRSILLQIRHQF